MKTLALFFKKHLLFIIQWALICAFFGVFIARYYPLVGADYRYFIPRLIDSQLHYRINGLSIQWYTPSFGGGLPSYGNPQQIQFSLPQLLTALMDPFSASLLAILVYISIGLVGFYVLGRNILKLDLTATLAGGLFFIINGFSLQHMGIGHLTFMGFPLLSIVLCCLLAKKRPLLNGAALGLTFSALLYGGAFYTIVYFAFSVGISLPLISLARPASIDLLKTAKNAAAGALFTVALSGSKLVAVLAFLRNFPRNIADVYQNSDLQSLLSIPLQLAGSMLLSPIGMVTGQNHKYAWDLLMTYTGSDLSMWELDTAISPVLLVILMIGVALILLPSFKHAPTWIRANWVSLFGLCAALWLTVEFITARGVFYPSLSKLPILDSLHVNPRYTSALLMPLSLTGAFIIQSLLAKFYIGHRGRLVIWGCITSLTLAVGMVYFALPMDSLQRRQFDVSGSVVIWKNVQRGESYPILTIQDDLRDQRVFDQNASTLTPYEVLFGYGLKYFKPAVRPGSVYDLRDGHYNMNDPSGFVYGDINGSKPFDRIPSTDLDKLEDLIHRRQPHYKLPGLQIGANLVSLGALILILVIFFSEISNAIQVNKLAHQHKSEA